MKLESISVCKDSCLCSVYSKSELSESFSIARVQTAALVIPRLQIYSRRLHFCPAVYIKNNTLLKWRAIC